MDGRKPINGGIVTYMPFGGSGNIDRYVPQLASGVHGDAQNTTLGYLAVKYSGRFDEYRFYEGDLPT